jgi:SAM-dependent methyltransferase
MTRSAALTRELSGRTCTAPAGRSDRMRDIVVASVPRDRPLRVLDVGCGTGSLVFRLAAALPLATVVGIDLSAANIEAANRSRPASADAARVRFEVADYTSYRTGPVDVVVTDGVLHLIDGDSEGLVAKIAGDLVAGGLFVCDMPYDCAYNRAFATVRQVLRTIRSPLTDAVILQAARILHGRRMDDRGLRERVGYMYIPPVRMLGAPLLAQFIAAGLRPTAEHAVRSTSPSQLRHRVTVFEKGAPAR